LDYIEYTIGILFADAHVTDLERLEKLFSLTMIAFVCTIKLGTFSMKTFKKQK